MKGYPYSEVVALKNIDNFTLKQFGRAEFVDKKNPAEIDISLANDALKHAEEIIKSHEYDLLILDEINVALDYKLIELKEVLMLLKEKPEDLDLIMNLWMGQDIVRWKKIKIAGKIPATIRIRGNLDNHSFRYVLIDSGKILKSGSGLLKKLKALRSFIRLILQ